MSNQEKKNNGNNVLSSTEKNLLLLFSVVVVLGPIVLWLVLYNERCRLLLNDLKSIGGSLQAWGVIVTGISTGFLLYTIFLQRKEFNAQKIELSKSAKAQQDSARLLMRQISESRQKGRAELDLSAKTALLNYYLNESRYYRNNGSAKKAAEFEEKLNVMVAEVERIRFRNNIGF